MRSQDLRVGVKPTSQYLMYAYVYVDIYINIYTYTCIYVSTHICPLKKTTSPIPSSQDLRTKINMIRFREGGRSFLFITGLLGGGSRKELGK